MSTKCLLNFLFMIWMAFVHEMLQRMLFPALSVLKTRIIEKDILNQEIKSTTTFLSMVQTNL